MNKKSIIIVVSLAFYSLIITVSSINILSKTDSPRRTHDEQIDLCKNMFNSGDKVNGMSDNCYKYYLDNGLLMKNGLYVK